MTLFILDYNSGIPILPLRQLPGSSGNSLEHNRPAAIAPSIGPIKCSAWKFHWPEVWPLTYDRAYRAAGLNILPLFGTPIIISKTIGTDTKYAGSLLTSSSSGIATMVHMYAHVTDDSFNSPWSQKLES